MISIHLWVRCRAPQVISILGKRGCTFIVYGMRLITYNFLDEAAPSSKTKSAQNVLRPLFVCWVNVLGLTLPFREPVKLLAGIRNSQCKVGASTRKRIWLRHRLKITTSYVRFSWSGPPPRASTAAKHVPHLSQASSSLFRFPFARGGCSATI